MSDSLFDRGKALEDRFFSEKDQQLLEQLKQELADTESSHALAAATGIEDESVLKALVDQNISVESLTSISLVPLVTVAWADGIMETNERSAILKAAEAAGIATGSAAHQLLENWMNNQPEGDLLEAWKAYIGALKGSLEAAAFNQIKSSVMGRARKVASAAGGFLGIGNTSEKELAVLDDLESSFG